MGACRASRIGKKNLVEALEQKIRVEASTGRKRPREDGDYGSRKRLAKTEPGYLPPGYQQQVVANAQFFWPQFPKHSKLDINECQRWNEHDVLEWLDGLPPIGEHYKKSILGKRSRWETAGRSLISSAFH